MTPSAAKSSRVLAKEITLAARAGGGSPESNTRLRSLIDKARAANMPADNIKRAVQKGTGEIPGVIYEEIVYEGYAPGGVGLIVEVTTDNKNRAAAEVRQAFNDNGGNMAQTGAVSHSFLKKGQFLIGASQIGEDALMELVLEAGAEDVVNNGDHFEGAFPDLSLRCYLQGPAGEVYQAGVGRVGLRLQHPRAGRRRRRGQAGVGAHRRP